MASGFGEYVSGGYIEITNGSTYATAAKVAAYLTQSIDTRARTVTVNVEATLAFYRTRGNWDLGAGESIYISNSGSNHLRITLSSQSSDSGYGGQWGLKTTYGYRAVQGGTYTYRGGYVTGNGSFAHNFSRTWSYDQQGNAISKHWKVELQLYSSAAGSPTISVEGDFMTDRIEASYTNPSMSNASISNTVLGPYHLLSSVSGVNYGSNYSSTRLTCRANYSLDGVNYSRDIQSWTNGVTSATCNIDSPDFSPSSPWTILPDGNDVNITWIAESWGSGGSGSASKTQTTYMPFAYSAYVVEPVGLGTSRTWTVIDDNKMLTTNNLTTMLGYVQQHYPDVQGDFDLILYRTGGNNKYSLKLHTSVETLTLFENYSSSQANLWLSSNMGTTISTFQTREGYYPRDTFIRFSYHLAKITPADLKVSQSQGTQPTKWVRRLDVIYPAPEPFKGWGYLYIGDTDNEEDWAEFNLDEQDFLRLCTNKDYIMLDGRKFSKDLVRAISFGPNVTEIGSFFLRDCINLNYDIELPDTCTHIGDYFLAGCTSFNSEIDLNNVTSIGNFFLQDCSSFNQELDISGVDTVGMGFMLRCTSFNQDIDISNLTSFGTYFMHDCNDFCSQIALGTMTYTPDIYSFSTTSDDTLHYLNGVELLGTASQIQTFETAFPPRDESPYRWYYSGAEVEALTAQEYDTLQLTSDDYDVHQLTARQYDTKGKTILS